MSPAASRRFAVALSFPGERREYVEKVAQALLPAFGGEGAGKARVFYDDWHEGEIIGYGSSRKLQTIYAQDSDLIVPFYCQDYLNKKWCGVELRAIEELLFDQQYDRVLPFRFDMVDIPSSFKTDIFPVVTGRPPEEIAGLIIDRYNQIHETVLELPVTPLTPLPRAGNVRRANPVFVGRGPEMKQLEGAVFTGRIGVVTAVHGMGGMGKTELAVAFADRYAERFPAGRWLLEAEGRKSILPLVGELTLDLGLPASAGPNETGDQRGRRVLAELKRRALDVRGRDPDQGAACLVLLDNVSDAALLAEPQLATLPSEDWLRVIVTTRLGPESLHPKFQQSFAFIPVDALGEDEAVKLIREHQPDGQWPAATGLDDAAAALTLVRELGGFTVAVEAVALYLGLHSEIRPAAYLARLKKEGLPTADGLGSDPDVAAQMQHREKQLGLVLDATLEKLTPTARAALDYAALLPPDSIPWPWLRTLVAEDHPDALRQDEGYPDPWLAIRQRLEGLRLLTSGNHPGIARLHRLVGAHVKGRLHEKREREVAMNLAGVLAATGSLLEETAEHENTHVWMLQPLQESLLRRDSVAASEPLALAADVAGGLEMRLGRLDRARVFLKMAERHRLALYDAARENPIAARNLSVTLTKLGDYLASRGQPGDAKEAMGHYQRSLEVRERLLAATPGSAQAARDVSVSLERLGDFLSRRGQPGDANRALGHYQRSLEARERLIAANPGSAKAARDVSASLERLGDFLARRGQPGDAKRALGHYQRSLEVRGRLLAATPGSGQAARDVSTSMNKLADFLARRSQPGDAEQALGHYQRSLEVSERLLAANPDSTEAARDVSASLSKLADFLARRAQSGDSEQALGHYQRSLAVREGLLAANPDSAQAARDVSMSLQRLGDFLASRGQPGDAEQALGHCQRSLEVREGLLAANPDSAEAARDVSVSLERLGSFQGSRGRPGDAEQALGHYQRSLEVREGLLAATPDSAEAARDVSVSLERLGDFLASRGQLLDAAQALGHYERSLEVRERLLVANPDSAQAARDVSVSLNKLADFLARRGQPGDAEQALGHCQRSLTVGERLLAANPDSAEAARDVSVSLSKLADVLARRGQPGDAEQALGHYQRSLAVRERLLAANPDSAQAARDVSVSLSKLAGFLTRRAQSGDAERALSHYQRSLEVSERLLVANPDSAQAARDMSVSLNKLADFLASRGQPEDAEQALGHYQRSLEVSERLLVANPDSAQAARDVSVTWERLGDFLASRGQPGDAAQALGHYQRSLAVRERLLAADTDSAQAARDVMVSLERMAQAAGGQPGADATRQALDFQRRALDIALKLRAGNPRSVFFGRAAAVSCYLASQRAQAAGVQELAAQCLRDCHAVLHELITAGCQLDAQMAEFYKELHASADGPQSAR